MYLPRGLWTSNQSTRTKTYIPKTLFTFFIILNLFFGLDFGFSRYLEKNSRRLTKCLWSIFSMCMLAIFITTLVGSDDWFFAYWCLCDLINFSLNFLILYYTKYNFLDYIEDLNQIDSAVVDLKKEALGMFALIYAILPLSAELLFDFIRCVNLEMADDEVCGQAYLPFIFFDLAVFSYEVVSIVYILIYYYMYCYVKKYNDNLKASKIKIQKLQKDYVGLTNCFDKIMPLYDKLLSVELLCEVQRIMHISYIMLYYIKTQEDWTTYISEAFYVAPIIIHMVVPFIATEILHSQLDNLKLNLNKKLLEETESSQNKEIKKMLQYMETHHMQHKMWRSIPNDLRLSGTIIGICVTYFIVIVQFAHLF